MTTEQMIAHLVLHGWQPRSLKDMYAGTRNGLVWSGAYDGKETIVWINTLTGGEVAASNYSQDMYDLGENVIRDWLPIYVSRLFNYIMEHKL